MTIPIDLATPPTPPPPQEAHEKEIIYDAYFNLPLHWHSVKIEFDPQKVTLARLTPERLNQFGDLIGRFSGRLVGNAFLASEILQRPEIHLPLRENTRVDEIVFPGTIWRASFGGDNQFFHVLRWIGESFNGKKNIPVNRWYPELVNLKKTPVSSLVVPVFT